MDLNRLHRPDLMGWIIVLLVMLLAVGIIGGLFLIEIPKGNRDAALLALGIVLGWGGSIVQWRFGSSHGSDRKTDLLAGVPPVPDKEIV